MKLIFILFFGINLFVYGQTNDWNSLEKTEFSIQYPKHWTIDESGRMGTKFIIFSPLSDVKDIFKDNVNFIIQDLIGHKISLKEYTEISKRQIKSMITDSEILLCTTEKSHNLNFQKLIYTGRQGVYLLHFIQYYWVENNKAYILTFTTETAQFDRYKDIGNRILSSFKIK